MDKVYIATNKLPGALGAALFLAEVSTRDIAFQASDRAYACSGGSGKRAWMILIPDVTSPEGMKRFTGAFGGPNPYENHAIDEYACNGIDVPEHGAIFTGVGSYSVCYVRAATLARLLEPTHPATMVALDAIGSDQPHKANEAASEALQDHEAKRGQILNAHRWTLYVFKTIKSSYRTSELAELARETKSKAGSPDMVEKLIALGYLKRNSAGSIAITTEGKNVARERPYGVREQLPMLAMEIA